MPLEKEKFRILCFIPTKNCQNTLAEVLANFSKEVLGYIEEILVVDNASTDHTVQVARDELAKIPDTRCTILQNSRNFGLGGSHKIAMNYAHENGFDYLIVLHGDNSVRIGDILPLLKNHRYLEFDALLGSRFHRSSRRENYPAHRWVFNLVVNAVASLVARKWISDFTGAALSCYRVSSYLNKFENPIKRYSNDVSFPQFVTLYSTYRRHRVQYFPVTHRERDTKPRDKLISQFGKAIVLLFKFFIAPEKSIAHDVYGTFFGHTFRRIKVRELEVTAPTETKKAEVVLSVAREAEVTTPPAPKPVLVEEKTPVAPLAPKKASDLVLIDLQKLRLPDLYNPAQPVADIPSLETCDLTDNHLLWIRTKLDVETVCSKGLRASFLHLFKIYSAEKIHVEINADRVLRSKQFLDFLQFLSDHGIKAGLVSMNPGNTGLWKKFAPLVDSVTMNYEYGSISREDFVTFTNEILQKQTALYLNILTHHQHFYHCYGLYDQLRAHGSQRSLRLQPYLSPDKSEKPKDHLDLLKEPLLQEPVTRLYREHYQLSPEISLAEAKRMNEGKEFGFTRIVPGPGDRMKVVDLDQRGNLFLRTPEEAIPLGSLYSGPAQWSARLTQNS